MSGTTTNTQQKPHSLSLTFPPAAGIEILNGSNYTMWSSCILVLLQMNRLHTHTTQDMDPNDSTWDITEEMLIGMLEMYTLKDVWATIADDSKFKFCKAKWDELKCVYGGVGAMSTFNTWVALTGTHLIDLSLMLPQLQKLTNTRTTLTNKTMEIPDLQFCFILIKALPDSYSAIASTTLAIGAPSALTPLTIQEYILNEEGR